MSHQFDQDAVSNDAQLTEADQRAAQAEARVAALEAELQGHRLRSVLYQRVMDNTDLLGIIVFDRELQYLVAEGGALLKAGFPSHEVVGRTAHEVLRPHARDM